MGVPFFEKYSILFDKDNNEVVIYDVIKKEKDNRNKFLIFCTYIFSPIILILLFFLVYKIIRKRGNKINSETIEKNIHRFGLLEPKINTI